MSEEKYPNKKNCEECGTVYSRPVYKSGPQNIAEWMKRKYCKKQCSIKVSRRTHNKYFRGVGQYQKRLLGNNE